MIVIPFQSVGELCFSDTCSVLRKKVNGKFEPGVKGSDETFKEYYDYFPESGVFIYYDEKDNVTAFEFFSPNPIFNETNLLKEPMESLFTRFSDLDPDLTGNSTEFTSNKYGIGAIISYESDDHILLPEAVIVFRKGYYDKLQEFISKTMG